MTPGEDGEMPRRREDEEICWLSATELANLIRTRVLSSREVVQAHLNRIDQVNPEINAIVSIDADRALQEAESADQKLTEGQDVGPLHGLPTAFKDTHATAGMLTTYGSRIFADNIPARDDLVVERIRRAGAVTLGKTNVPEFAAGSHTFNAIFGVTRNPYDLSRSAGGSSGGAAAALAAGLVPLAEGSDMGGSLRNPASFCNVVGLRPTPGRVPEFPSDLAWQTLNVQGPMGRTVDDVALLLSAISGPDARCPLSLSDPGSTFRPPIDPRLGTGLRVAWSSDFGGTVPVDPEVASVISKQAQIFEHLGCVVEEACPDLRTADHVFKTLRAWAFAHSMGAILREHRDLLKPSLVWNIELGERLTGAEVARALALQAGLFRSMVTFFEHYDILLLPTAQVLPFDVDLEYPTTVAGRSDHTYLDWMRSCYYISPTGCPAMSVPAGFSADGLPVGMQIVAGPRQDGLVLHVARAFEEATGVGGRRPKPVVLESNCRDRDRS